MLFYQLCGMFFDASLKKFKAVAGSKNNRTFASMVVHPLHTDIPKPERFTYPFCYEPHPLCQLAAKEVQQYIAEHEAIKTDADGGKMFGVLVVEMDDGRCKTEDGRCKTEDGRCKTEDGRGKTLGLFGGL